MDAEFWHDKWQSNDIAFHERQVNPFLVRHLEKLNLSANNRVFLPLCGKTVDVAWLLDKGLRVAGAELSEIAIRDLFKSLGLQPEIRNVGSLLHYQEKNIDIYVGDIFGLDASTLGPVDAVFDRAALVALPEKNRKLYASHLTALTSSAPQLLITFEYDQALMQGPPFCVNEAEVRSLYGSEFHLNLVEGKEVEGKLKDKVEASEQVWLLEKFRR